MAFITKALTDTTLHPKLVPANPAEPAQQLPPNCPLCGNPMKPLEEVYRERPLWRPDADENMPASDRSWVERAQEQQAGQTQPDQNPPPRAEPQIVDPLEPKQEPEPVT